MFHRCARGTLQRPTGRWDTWFQMDPPTGTTGLRATMKTPDTEIGRSFDVESRVLANGLTILLVENPVIPALAINATVLAGARHEPEEIAGLAIMASNLLDEGTKTRSSLDIAEAIESTGGHLETDA